MIVRKSKLEQTIPQAKGLIRLTVLNEMLHLESFTAGSYVKSWYEIEGDDEWSCCIDGKMLKEIIKSLQGLDITIERRDDFLEILTHESTIICPISSDEFPDVPLLEEEQGCYNLNGRDLLYYVRNCRHGLSGRQNEKLSSYSLIGDEYEIEVTAADRNRVVKAGFKGVEPKYKLLVPGGALNRMLPYMSELLNLKVYENHVAFEGKETSFIIAKVDGIPMNTEASFIDAAKQVLEINKEELINVLKACLTINNGCVHVKLVENKMVFESVNTSGVLFNNVLHLNQEVKPYEFDIKTMYFLHAINNISDKKVILSVYGPKRPIMISSSKTKEIILPII